MPTLDELMAEDEAKKIADYQAEENAKREAWDKLSPEQQQAYLDEKERQHREYMAKFEDQEKGDDDGDDDDGDDDDDDDQSDAEID